MHMTQPDWPVERFRVLLDRILEQTGLPQGKLAALVPMNQSQFSRWKSAKAKPKFESLAAFAEAVERDFPQLGISKREILSSGGYGDTLDGSEPAGGLPAHPSDDLPRIGAEDGWVKDPPPDLWLGLVWEDLTLAERMIWHLPNTSPATRLRLMRALQNELEAEIAAERYGQGLDVRADRQRGRGVNGA